MLLNYFRENYRKVQFLILIASIFITGCAAIIRLKFLVPFAGTWDQVDFSLALSRFDLLTMQPHFPGYPYFILGGMLFQSIFKWPAPESLAAFNSFLYLSAALPMFLIARKSLNATKSLVAVAVVQSAVFINVIVVQPMSEGAALAIVWWFLWSLIEARNREEVFWKWLPSFLFGIMLGVRLSYIVFGAGLLLMWLEEWRSAPKNRRVVQLLTSIFWACIFQLIWVGGLIGSVGGVSSFFKLAFSFTGGHFNDWGGAVSSADIPFGERIITLFFYNLIWTGLCGQSYFVLSFIALAAVLIAIRVSTGKAVSAGGRVLCIIGGIYFLWALFAQNIDKPRHTVPIAGIILLLLFMKFLESESKLVPGIVLLFASVQLALSHGLMEKQAEEMPATYQLASFLNKEKGDFIVYTWEETRVMDYLDVDYLHKRVLHFDFFLQDISHYKNDTIYLTDHVVKGFTQQGEDVSPYLERVASFKSHSIFDPVYDEIVLYKWKTEKME